jgi:hypothetical protein
MFAIGFKGVDLTDYETKKYFDIKMTRFDVIKKKKVMTKI